MGGLHNSNGGEDRDNQRKKEVEDLITKYTKKKDPSEVSLSFILFARLLYDIKCLSVIINNLDWLSLSLICWKN